MVKSKSSPTISLETGMLAYARSIQITEGLFFGINLKEDKKQRVPIIILEKGVRGQSSQDNAGDSAANSNLQSVEFAVLPQGCSSAELEFSLRVMPLAMKPHACGNTAVGNAYTKLAEGYKSAGGFSYLAELYVWNLLNGRFAWRNRFQSDEMSVTAFFDGIEICFNPLAVDLTIPVARPHLAKLMSKGSAEDLDKLINGIAQGLSEKAFEVKVIWAAKMKPGQEIFPSQEYVREEKADKNISRILAKLPTLYRGREVQQASMHSQKIGAALRHIDIWHGDDGYGAIAVNPYGGVQETSAVLRSTKTKNSFYDIRAKADSLIGGVEKATSSADLSDHAHFVMANLIRGGVFGSSSKKAEVNE